MRVEDRHQISVKAEVMIRCTCGFKYRPDKIRGVSQDKLDKELMMAFEDHLDHMRNK